MGEVLSCDKDAGCPRGVACWVCVFCGVALCHLAPSLAAKAACSCLLMSTYNKSKIWPPITTQSSLGRISARFLTPPSCPVFTKPGRAQKQRGRRLLSRLFPPSCRTRARFPVPAYNMALRVYKSQQKAVIGAVLGGVLDLGLAIHTPSSLNPPFSRCKNHLGPPKGATCAFLRTFQKILPHMAPCVPKKQRFCLVLGVLLFCNHTQLVSASQNRPESTWKHQVVAVRPG